MKVAIPTRGSAVDDHFGHCEFYSIFTIDENKNIVASETLAAPEGCGCKSNIAGILQQMGVSVMLAGNMGMGALNVLNMHGIDVYRGNSGDVQTLIVEFLNGAVKDSGIGCHHHGGEGHQCNH